MGFGQVTKSESIDPAAGNHFGAFAEPAFLNGYSPVSLFPRQKRPRLGLDWRNACWSRVSHEWLQGHAASHPDSGVGLACGKCIVAFDLDVESEESVAVLRTIVEGICGRTQLVRIGREPRLALIYRAVEPIVSIRLPKVDILGLGTQIVAYGTHPETGNHYRWIGDSAPHLTPLSEVTGVTNAQCVEVASAIVRRVYGSQFNQMVFDVDIDVTKLQLTSRTQLAKLFLTSLFRGKEAARNEVERMIFENEIPPSYWGFVMRPTVHGGFNHGDFMRKLTRCEFIENPGESPT